MALGKIGDARAVPALVEALKDDFDRPVRERAAEALGMIGDTRALRPLIEAVSGDARSVRKRAAEALRILTGRSFGTDGDRWKAWWAETEGDVDADR